MGLVLSRFPDESITIQYGEDEVELTVLDVFSRRVKFRLATPTEASVQKPEGEIEHVFGGGVSLVIARLVSQSMRLIFVDGTEASIAVLKTLGDRAWMLFSAPEQVIIRRAELPEWYRFGPHKDRNKESDNGK